MTLPILDQGDYPPLPAKGSTIRVAGTTLNSGELEFAAAIIVAACATMGEWAPFSATVFGEVAESHPLTKLMGHGLIKSTLKLVDKGLVTITRVGETDYLIPNASFGNVVRRDNIIIVS